MEKHYGDHVVAHLNKKIWDKVGITLSVVCLAHCLLFPLIMAIFPIFKDELSHGAEFHFLLILLILPLAYSIFYKTWKKHGEKRPLKLGIVASLFLILGPSILELSEHSGLGLSLDRILTTIGSVILISAHIINLRVCRCHHH